MIKLRRILLIVFSVSITLLLSGCGSHYEVLNPKGAVAASERDLLITAVLLMLIVVIPVIIMALYFAWKYRASNTKAKYIPEWGHSNLLEAICWSIPLAIIVVLAILTWISSHRLDPYRPLNVKGKPVIIQAVALNWKWLFIYPDQHIATVNYIQIPVHTPVRFLIAGDGPMNSLAIPSLAGQIYAMAGMRTKLNIIANQQGTYRGFSANYSGPGFAGMKFNVIVTDDQQFNSWVKHVQTSPKKLTIDAYKQLAQPSADTPVTYYSSPAQNLFNLVIMQFMKPGIHVG